MLSKLTTKMYHFTVIICVITFTVCSLSPPGTFALQRSSASQASCVDLEYIFARGSGEPLNGASMTTWQTENTTAIKDAGLNLRYRFYELGSDPDAEFQYPASPVSGSVEGISNLLGAYFSAGSAFRFGQSVRIGEQELQAHLAEISASCPETKFVLGGYSQGAMLVTHSLPTLDSSRILYVANFGDPKTYLPEGKGNHPDACLGRNFSDYRAYVSDCHAYEGVLGSYRPYQPPAYLGKLGLWCNGLDIMCSSGFNIADHSQYVARGLYRDAAAHILDKVKQHYAPSSETPPATPPEPPKSTHDLVILFDHTGSMIGLANQYKMEAKRLAEAVWSQGGRVALFGYGDLRSLENIQYCDFSCTPEQFNAHLDKITHSLSGGDGTGRESALSALYNSMNRLSWQVGATKSAVLLTDGTYRTPDFDSTTLAQVVELSLKIDPVNVYALTASDVNVEAFAPLVSATNGRAYNLRTEAERALSEIAGRPSVSLNSETYEGLVGDQFHFAANSSVSFPRYDWDLDGDNVFETANAGPDVYQTYDAPLDTFIQVRVTSPKGYSSTMSARLTVRSSHPIVPTISNLQSTAVDPGKYHITFTTNADYLLVILNDAILGILDPRLTPDFTIADVLSRSVLRLMPYSTETRGEPRDLILDSANSPSSNLPSIFDPSESPTPNHPNANSSSPSTTLDLATNLAALRGLVPKVPNTGIFQED